MRRLLLVAVVLAAAACASDKNRVAAATAAYTFFEAEYEHACVEVKGPATCAETQKALVEAKRQIVLADRIYKIGKLPPEEKKAIKAALKKARAK